MHYYKTVPSAPLIQLNPKKYVFSSRRNSPSSVSGRRRSDGRLFQSRGPAAEKLRPPRRVSVLGGCRCLTEQNNYELNAVKLYANTETEDSVADLCWAAEATTKRRRQRTVGPAEGDRAVHKTRHANVARTGVAQSDGDLAGDVDPLLNARNELSKVGIENNDELVAQCPIT